MKSASTRAILAMIAASAMVVASCTGTPSATSNAVPSGPPPTTVPAPSRSTFAPPTAEPSPSAVRALGASGSGAFGPGTYATAFQPPLTFTLADLTIVGANGTIAYESIGEVDANMPAWISIGFGFDKPGRHGHGTWSGDFSIERIDKVFDPTHAGKVIDPPKDLATWITKLPGLTLAAPPKTTEIGGLDAVQLDVVSGAKDIAIGPIPDVTDPPGFGFGPHGEARIVVVSVDGHEVLIMLGGADSAAHNKRVVEALQPLVDSIVWH